MAEPVERKLKTFLCVALLLRAANTNPNAARYHKCLALPIAWTVDWPSGSFAYAQRASVTIQRRQLKYNYGCMLLLTFASTTVPVQDHAKGFGRCPWRSVRRFGTNPGIGSRSFGLTRLPDSRRARPFWPPAFSHRLRPHDLARLATTIWTRAP